MTARSLLPLLLTALPALADEPPVSFRTQIAPLLNRRCAACHNEESAKGRYRLDTFARLQKAGESEESPLTPGQPDHSQLYRLLVESDPHDRMPQKADPLPEAEIALIRRWIAGGAHFDGGAAGRSLVEMARESFLQAAPEHYEHAVPVTALAFSPDARLLATSGYYEVLLWSTADGLLAKRLSGLPERITALAWQPQLNLLAVAGGTPSQWGTVALVDPATGAVRILCDLPETALAVAFSPDGRLLAAGGGDRTVRLFDTASGKQVKLLRYHADWVQSVAFNPEGTKILSASRDRTVRVVDVKTGEVETTYNGHDAPLLQAAYNQRGTEVFSLAAHQRVLHRWKIAEPEKGSTVELGSEAQSFVAGSMGLVTATPQNTLQALQITDRRVLFQLFGHRDTVESLALGPKGEPLASGSYDGEVCLWDFACGTWRLRFRAQP